MKYDIYLLMSNQAMLNSKSKSKGRSIMLQSQVVPIAFLIFCCQRQRWVEEKENQDLPGGETFYNRVAEMLSHLTVLKNFLCIFKSDYKIAKFYANA